MTKKVAVIGSGASGLTAIKCCVDEGLHPVCFERTDHIGGLWYYTEEATDGQACVMKSTIINTSKEMMTYSDFPIPKEYPIYMHNKYVLKYFNLYADNFDLRKYIRFKTEVTSVSRSPDFNTSGQWNITTKDLTTGETKEHVFDAVMVCTGHHADKNIPEFPGISTYNKTFLFIGKCLGI
ncbi:flavin-containing monooxygenase 5-like [Saccostrea echinata]|uniref:flavin-containing monooxygenase 5-like n=1 Tax=Saccostrea echinata TaxID=191078 RepID=UPI002A80D62E|nr:flavin-containing monooxygenase 5-like [Saccostrea echinata]